MSDGFVQEVPKLGWHFPRTFWFANGAELFERAAFYGMFIALTVYLTDMVGFSDLAASVVGALFSSVLYFLPTFSGAMADRIGFRRALMLAFGLLTAGYFLLGALPNKPAVLAALAIIILGGSIIKPVISGTVAKCSDEAHRARAFSIFYMVVNIGAFTGKTAAKPLRTELGLEYINFYAAAMAFCALVLVALFYRDVDAASTGKTVRQLWQGLARVVRNGRFMALIVIVAGFWAIQGQLYATMPKYMLRLLGPSASPEWLANINPLVVICLVVPITHLVRRLKPASSIGIALFIIPFTALIISLSPVIQARTGDSVRLVGGFAVHPITLAVLIGVGLQGLAECFLSPRFLEYASKQAPKGEEGLYLGYQYLTTCIAWLFGFIVSGVAIDRWCPNPDTLPPEVHAQWLAATAGGPGAAELPEVYAHAHYIWYVFTIIGAAAFVALLIFKFVTDAIDRKRERSSLRSGGSPPDGRHSETPLEARR